MNSAGDTFAHVPLRRAPDGSTRSWTCRYYGLASMGMTTADTAPVQPVDGLQYTLICVDPDGNEQVNRVVTYNAANPGEPLGEAGDLAARINEGLLQIQAARPTIRVSPPRLDHQIVGVQTWFWIDEWGVTPGEIDVDGFRLALRARATSVRFDPGDGSDPVTCTPETAIAYRPDGPNPDRSPCGHTYFRSSADQPGGTYRVTASLQYGDVSWSLLDPAGTTLDGGTLPPVTADATVDLVVHEYQAVIR